MLKKKNVYQLLWDQLNTSGNRSDDPIYLKNKALEHAGVIRKPHTNLNCVDLGCGAGELLQFLVAHINITHAQDFSKPMLEEASSRVGDDSIEFINDDCFVFLKCSAVPVWLSTCALNQFLDREQLKILMSIFSSNSASKAIYFYDTVDPLRHVFRNLGSSYLGKNRSVFSIKSMFKYLYYFAQLPYRMLVLKFSNSTYRFHNRHNGYAHLPEVWFELAREYDLSVEIISSKYFEYRYHVILTKG